VRPGLVIGICVCFRDEPGFTTQRVEEPVFIIGQIEFGSKKAVPARPEFPAWVLWNGYFIWNDEQPINQVIALGSDIEKDIPQMKLAAMPLYSVKSISDVEKLLESLTGTTHA
jgi:hypothetical protein